MRIELSFMAAMKDKSEGIGKGTVLHNGDEGQKRGQCE
ncbi:hypothetical protein B4099_0176 [Heyndrickxia coagulans]|uniref:Uncharacterized protein n=1 Tax=Heyndrickxia coagulans TaxID=1398 RepID=A0A150K574_HEYCO|nr:hypothetical protein B4099_0176 [Heyndrickxia coagulans]